MRQSQSGHGHHSHGLVVGMWAAAGRRNIAPRALACLLALSGSVASGADFDESQRQLVRVESPNQDAPLDLRSLSPEERAGFVEMVKARAASFLRADPVKRLRSDRFAILTDLYHDEDVQMVAGNLESTFDVLDTVFGEPGMRNIEPIPVYVYGSSTRFTAMTTSFGVGSDAAGIYVQAVAFLAFTMTGPSKQSIAEVMIHEATHAYVDHYVRPEGVTFLPWLEEGIAQYVGNSRIRGGKLLLGTIRWRQRTAHGSMKSEPQLALDELRRSLKDAGRPTLEDLLVADRETFYGKEKHLYYAAAWMLVHSFRDTTDEQVRGRFPKLIEAICDGAESRKAVRAIYGDLVQVEAAYRRHVRQAGE